MTIFSKPFLAVLFFVVGLGMAALAGDVPVPVDQGGFDASLSQIKTKIDQLENSIARADSNGIETSSARVTLTTAQAFFAAIQWDLAHSAVITQMVAKYEWMDKKLAPELATDVPKQEASETVAILDRALAEMDGAPKNPILSRKLSTVKGQKLDLAHDFCFRGNSPVFLSSIIWMPERRQYTDAFGRLPSIYLTLKQLQEDGVTVGPNALEEIKKRAADYGRNGDAFEVFLDQNPPAWAVAKYPEIRDGHRQFIGYDIDNPKVREMWEKYLAVVVPEIRGKAGGLAVYMMANEPTWFTTTGTWSTGSVSEYTFQKFRKWLAVKYQNDVAAFNTSWGGSFASFEAVRLELPMSKSLKGSALWYDWCRFNMDRVNEWFLFLKSEIRKHDPQALCTIKPETGQWYDLRNERDGGLDYESFAYDVEDVSGADTAAEAPLDNRFRRYPNPGWAERYVCGWEVQSMYYDFLKSLAPKKILFDCEYHPLSAGDWRAPVVEPRYVRMIMWLAHLHGMGMNLAWYWPRQVNGQLTATDADAFFGSTGMQPQTVDAYGRTMKEVNAYAPEITALAGAPRPIRLFYSTDSEIQSPSFVQARTKAYEASYFLGTAVGFVTTKMLAAEKTAGLKAFSLLIIPSATHVDSAGLEQLKRYADSGGTLVVFGKDALAYDEHGRLREASALAFLKGAVRINLDEPVESIGARFESLLTNASAERLIVCRDQAGKIPWGVRYVSARHGGDILVYLVNVGKTAKTVSLTVGGRPVEKMHDRLSDTTADVRKLELEPYAVKLFSVPAGH